MINKILAIAAILDIILDSLLCNVQFDNYETGFIGFFDPQYLFLRHQMHLRVMNTREDINGFLVTAAIINTILDIFDDVTY